MPKMAQVNGDLPAVNSVTAQVDAAVIASNICYVHG